MGTKERRARELAAREQLFLEAARELIARDGLINLQMSRIPEMCDYAVGTLYQHFSSKEDLLVTLATVNNQRHMALFERVAAWQASTRDRMFALALADSLFVRKYPEHYRIAQFAFTEAVWKAATPERRQQALEAGKPAGEIVNGIVAAAIAAGDVDPAGLTSAELSLGVWSMAVGMQSLRHTEGLLELYDVRDPHYLIAYHTQRLLNGLGWQPLFDPADRKALEAKVQALNDEVFHDCNF